MEGAYPWITYALNDLPRRVRRPVIDQKELKITKRLLEDALNG
jgi:hypothetical protein